MVFALTFVMLVTSVSMAVARAGMPLHGILVLCVGEEVVVVHRGADGAPIEGEHVCPDCTVGPLADIGQPHVQDLHARPAPHRPYDRAWITPTLTPYAPTARAPPAAFL